MSALAGFPLNLVIALLILALYKPSMPWLIWAAMAFVTIAGGFFLPLDLQVTYWSPGGTASLMATLAVYLYFFPKPDFASESISSVFSDRRTIRETLSKTVSLAERQKIYLNFVGNRQRNMLRHEEKITPLNTKYFTLILFALFAGIYTIMELQVFHSDAFNKLFNATIREAMGTYQQYAPDKPEDVEKAIEAAITQARDLLNNYSIIYIFAINLLYTLFLFSLSSLILRLRKLPAGSFGSFSLFRVPDMGVWVFLGLIGIIIAFEQLWPDSPWGYIPVNLLMIIASLYILQGMGTLWLFFHIRLMPGGSAILLIFLIGLLFNTFILMALFAFFLFGLLEFWFDFRKKALHPKMLSDDAL